ncbi:APC family permease [Nitrosophilus alvini]|uniref:APC family permease n=1 Tax=Nitrosophilus alvini TaxID=2714855 RepID=UPI00190D6583|nr:amino acid permease [Nitrosophilus alvini]
MRISLKREITLPLLIFYGLGNIIGAGIYVLIGEVAAISGYYAPLSFVAACIVVIFTVFSYAELSARFPFSAAEAVYVKEGFGLKSPLLPVVVGFILAFSGLVSSAAVVSGFYGYVEVFIPFSREIVIFALVFLLFAIAAWGIGESVKTASFFTLIEIGGLLLVIGAGLYYADFENIDFGRFVPKADISIMYSIFLGGFIAFFAFIGFEDMVNVAEEVKNPVKTLPKAIVITITIATLLYFAIAFVSLIVMSPEELAASKAPLADVFMKAVGGDVRILHIIGILAVINGALVQIIMVSRVLYGMSSQGWLPEWLGRVHPYTKTPVYATAIVAAVVFFLAVWVKIVTLAQLTSFGILIVFTLINAALLNIKIKRKSRCEGINVPFFVPIMGIITNVALISLQIYEYLG